MDIINDLLGNNKQKKQKQEMNIFSSKGKVFGSLFRDSDGDGVCDALDCKPYDPHMQHSWKKQGYITEKELENRRKKNPIDYSAMSFQQYTKQQKKNLQDLPVIKTIGRYKIYAVKQKTGEIFYYAVDSKTGRHVLSGRRSMKEMVKDIKKGDIKTATKQLMKVHKAKSLEDLHRKQYKSFIRQVDLEKKYGGKAKRSSFGTGSYVLDIGAGDNPDLRATHAIDLRQASEQLKGISYKSGYDFGKESTNLPYNNNYFKVVVSIGALGMNFRSANIYKEIYRVLKQGGRYETNSADKTDIKMLKDAGFKKISSSYYHDECLDKNISFLIAYKR